MNKFKGDLSYKFAVILIVIMIIIFAFPLYFILTMSLKTGVDSFSYPPKWIFKPIIDNYVNLFVSESFLKYLFNSTIISVISVLIALIIGAPASYALSKLKVKWVPHVLFSILVARMIPPMSLLLPYFNIYINIGLIDTHIGTILAYETFLLPLAVWLMKTFYDTVPDDIEEAATIDGASKFKVFYLISTPLIKNAIIAAGVISFIKAWSEYLIPLILTRDKSSVATVAINQFMRFEDIQWGLIASSAVVISLPAVIFGIIVRKHLISGLTDGSVK